MKSITAVAALAAVAGACAEPATQVASPHGAPASRALPYTAGQVVMTQLANPRGMAWSPDGALYVAEAGRGGTAPCFLLFGPIPNCYGETGGVSRLRDGAQERVISDLPSYAQINSGQAEGPNGISFHGNGGAYVTIGLETNPAVRRAAAPEWNNMARLVHIEPSALSHGKGAGHSKKSWEFVADLGQYEIDRNPGCDDIDSNPFGVLAEGGGVIVMDAGANTMIRLAANGDLSTMLAFPNNTAGLGEGCPPRATRDFVPTAIIKGPDNAYYFGHLNGLSILPGSSKVWRMEPDGAPEVFADNLTWIVALAFDPSDNLYVLQYSDGPLAASGGSLVRVKTDGSRETVVTGLRNAGGMTVGSDGAVYISMIPVGNAKSPGEVRRYIIP